jgi:chromosome segregation ATPase
MSDPREPRDSGSREFLAEAEEILENLAEGLLELESSSAQGDPDPLAPPRVVAEAAVQAGEQGKNFAVVAHEIKSLSDRTASSTNEISRIVRGIRDRMGSATEAVSRGQQETGRSVELAERAGRTLQKILSTALVSHEMTIEILRGTEEQSRRSENVMASMEQVSGMVSYIRQAAGEHRTTGERVTENAAVMRRLTELMKLSTAEQAEAGRYLSEAIAAADQNLQNLLQLVRRGKEDVQSIVDQLAHLKLGVAGHDASVREVEGAIAELFGRPEP